MGSNYQQIGNYNGSLYGTPQHQGLEYDWEVPDHGIVGSPGGVSTVHHHPTKGFYGRGNTSSDIFAGTGQGYLAGGFGNLYETGHNAIYKEQMFSDPPDYQHWQHQEPQQQDLQYSEMPKTENYESGHDSSFELIESDNYSKNPSVEGFSNGTNIGVKSKMSPWLLLLLILFIFIVIFLWSKTGDRFIVQYLNNGRKPSWQKMTVYSLVATVVLILILYLVGFPEISFE